MTFEQLQYFTEVYRQKSITYAANNLYVSRQTLSAIIKKLEIEFGCTLFNRSSNGVEPTNAAHDFYQSAQKILNEYSILNQKMLNQVSNNKNKLQTCNIGMSEFLIDVYSEPLSDILSSSFPQTYFNFYSIQPKDSKRATTFYEKYDIAIILLSKYNLDGCKILLNDFFEIKQLSAIPIYIRISADSPFAKQPIVSFEQLKGLPFCALKNHTSTLGFCKYSGLLQSKEAPVITELKQNFVDYIEQFGYYTVDFPINKGSSFLYEDILQNKEKIVLKKTSEQFYITLMYKKDFQDFYHIFADMLSF